MNEALATTARWLVSTRADGEVLTAGAGSDGVEFAVVGFPDRFTSEEIRGWLNDLTGVARETALGDASARTIPPLLHHALTGLLFSHAELWESDGITRPCSAAFVEVGGQVAFGWVGEALPEVWVDEGPLAEVYTRVRDDENREALGIAFDASHRVRVRLTWTALPGAIDAPSGVIEAEWAGGPAGFEETLAMDTLAVSALAEPRVTRTTIVHPGGQDVLPPAEAVATVEATQDEPLAPEPLEPPAPALEEVRIVEEATAAVELPGQGRAKQGIFRRLTGWLRRDKPATPAEEPAMAEPAGAELTPAESDALANPPQADEATAALAADEDVETHERLFPETPAPPALAQAEEVLEDPHERVLGPPAPTAAPPVIHVPRVVERTNAGPPVLRVTRVTEESVPPPVAPRPEPPAAVGPPALEPAPAPMAPPAPVAPAAAEPPPPAPPAWEPPSSMIADASGASSEEAALAAALAALAAEQAVTTTTPPVPVAPPVVAEAPPAPRPATPALGASDAMRAALSARAAARPAPEPDVRESSAPPPEPVVDEPHAEPSFAAPPSVPDEAGPERPILRPEWPSADELQPPVPLWRRPWAWGVMVVALFLGGWFVGLVQPSRDQAPRRSPLVALVRGLGLGGARYDVMVNSHPSGAWIAVDGKDLARRTPASIDLSPGEHAVTLSLSDLGGQTFKVRGQRGEQVSLDAPLWGTLDVLAADGSPPVTVTFDGKDVGFAPAHLDSVQPGAHDLRFSGPGMPAWGQPVEVRVGQKAEVLARPMSSPATGVIEVRASITDDDGSRALPGAAVIVDGESRGATPLTLELPRGPHSVRVTYRDQSAPVQVIDLPGGNQRFADFELGVGGGRPQLVPLDGAPRFANGRPAVLSIGLDGVNAIDVREMWLHVRTPEGAWRRYQMEILRSTTGVVGVAVFPTNLFGAGTRARWYGSATVSTGDEYFTEIGNADIAAAGPEHRPGR